MKFSVFALVVAFTGSVIAAPAASSLDDVGSQKCLGSEHVGNRVAEEIKKAYKNYKPKAQKCTDDQYDNDDCPIEKEDGEHFGYNTTYLKELFDPCVFYSENINGNGKEGVGACPDSKGVLQRKSTTCLARKADSDGQPVPGNEVTNCLYEAHGDSLYQNKHHNFEVKTSYSFCLHTFCQFYAEAGKDGRAGCQ